MTKEFILRKYISHKKKNAMQCITIHRVKKNCLWILILNIKMVLHNSIIPLLSNVPQRERLAKILILI